MSSPRPTLSSLLDLVALLRGPGGCPWDREQGLQEIRGYMLEEAHELADAIDGGDWNEIREELGDLAFQIAFLTQLGREQSTLELDEVMASIHQKMVDRHPHVFGDASLASSRDVHDAWERRKLRDGDSQRSVLAGVPRGLPALLATYRMTQKASGVGFDWPDTGAVLDKVEEELGELRAELDRSPEGVDSRVGSELGDLLFTLANLCRHLGRDPEAVLAAANRKFRRRVEAMESTLAQRDLTLADLDAQAMDELWEAVKSSETD